MKTRCRYKVTIEDESRLETVAEFSATPVKWFMLGGGVVLVIMALGAMVLSFTPARNLLPGYLKESERTANQMQLLRLDSLKMAYETNSAFLDNIMNVLNPVTSLRQDSAVSSATVPLSPDSLLPTSQEEEKFVAMMREREKYNVSVIAPLAAESLMFSSVSDNAVVSESSRSSQRAEFIMAKGSPVSAIADGTVIAVSQSMRDGGATIIIQHSKGFLSRISRLGTVLVETGDQVAGGQIIALTNRGNGKKGEIVYLEMWHNGDSLVPYEYIEKQESKLPPYPVVDKDVGRGRL